MNNFAQWHKQLVKLHDDIDMRVPKRTVFTEDYELGTDSLSNKKGEKSVIWQAYYDEEQSAIMLKNTVSQQVIAVLNDMQGITNVGLAFDGQMNMHLCYVQNGVAKLHWFDHRTQQHETLALDGVQYPCMTFDDIRPQNAEVATVILAYMKGTMLCYRYLNEYFAIEHEVQEISRGKLWQIASTVANRLKLTWQYVEYK